jgi:zinc/manganese transport system substrate-binding protein
MRIIVNRAVLAALAISAALTVSACGSTASGGAPSSNGAAGTGDQSPIPVVTSTNVWGDIARQVGGDQVAVTALIVDPAADPHSFEPNAQAQLALSKASLVVENGGGYDDFMQNLTHAAGLSAPVITAVELFGADADGAAPSGPAGQAPSNEHVWYDFPTVDAVATKIAGELTTIAPAQAAHFQANLSAFTDKLAGLTSKLGAIKAAHDGAPVAITEPVPLYLTQAAGLVNKTPPAFSAAIEEGTDVPPTVLSDTLALFTGAQVVALVYNEQTSSPETEKLLSAAKDNAVPAVGVTETLPAGADYLSWMDANITALKAALG